VSIEWYRDLAVCILGVGITVGVVIIVVLACLLYLRIKPIRDALKETSQTVANISSSVENEVAKPIAQAVAFFQGIRQAVGLVRNITRKEED
jgi:hypothetical protein